MADKKQVPATAQEAFEMAQEVADLADAQDNIQLKRQVVELMQKVLQLQVEDAAKTARIAELEQQAILAESMTFDGTLYWQEKGESRDGPFCQRCFDAERMAVRLQPAQKKHLPPWKCRVCESEYGKGEPRVARRSSSRPTRGW